MVDKSNAYQQTGAHMAHIARMCGTFTLVTVLLGFAGAAEPVALPLAQTGQAEASSKHQRIVPSPTATGLPFRPILE
jgi:hypothetical protein